MGSPVRLGSVMSRDDAATAYLACASVSLDLASRDEVAAAWTHESSCEGMTVGGLVDHLLAQLRHVAQGLRVPAAPEAPVVGLLDHYSQAPWVAASREGVLDPDQNDTNNSAAEAGFDAVLAAARSEREALPALLAAPRSPDVIHIPWQGWSLATPDFLTTRMMELVVHGDDLAASVGVDTPEHDPAVVAAVLGLLADVSLARHGQVALVRALSRPQRSTGDVSAF
ncbi:MULTISPECIES: maleylpyruvate isomerase N-terminal domain-containing protein [unclassified Knoellia]|uniref:maleylpyruvate isomerase N-terminal domain-containing protein n=1 Tax=Knoellia altitudinis TaxID=3404795 RepID=UPI0036189D26